MTAPTWSFWEESRAPVSEQYAYNKDGEGPLWEAPMLECGTLKFTGYCFLRRSESLRLKRDQDSPGSRCWVGSHLPFFGPQHLQRLGAVPQKALRPSPKLTSFPGADTAPVLCTGLGFSACFHTETVLNQSTEHNKSQGVLRVLSPPRSVWSKMVMVN